MYAYEHAFSDQEAWEWLRRQQARYRKDGFGLWAAVERTSGEMVGQCGLTWQGLGDGTGGELDAKRPEGWFLAR